MTTEEFEQWLIDQEKSFSKFADMLSSDGAEGKIKISHQAMAATFAQVLIKYRSILPPPTTLN